MGSLTGKVAQPALIAYAMNSAAEQARVEVRLAPCKKLDERNVIEAIANREVRLGAGLREPVPRAHELAIVAAVHAIADERP